MRRWSRMRRLAVLMTLVAALTGTPLRQAEAADDLCRSIIELLQTANIEIPDGGVGDDSGVGTLSGSHTSSLADPFTSTVRLLLPPVSAESPPTPCEVEALREVVWWPPNPPNVRHAWLQNFLF
jgi:hypothetical protein